MHLNNVVFPHPDGPIKAVTQFFLNSISIFFKASLVPNQPFNEVIESLASSLMPEAEEFFLEEIKAEDLASGFLFCEDFNILNNKSPIIQQYYGYNIIYITYMK
jgi:hypothetical protein